MSDVSTIVENAHQLFTRYGIKTVSMDDIARACAISKKTLYQSISDKKDLVEKVLDYEFDKRNKAVVEICNQNENAIDELLKINKYMGKFLTENRFAFEFDLQKYYPDLYVPLMERKNKAMYERLHSNMEAGIKQGIYRSDVNTRIITKLHVARMGNKQFAESFVHTDLSPGTVFREIIIYHIRGIANDEGISYLEKKIENNEI